VCLPLLAFADDLGSIPEGFDDDDDEGRSGLWRSSKRRKHNSFFFFCEESSIFRWWKEGKKNYESCFSARRRGASATSAPCPREAWPAPLEAAGCRLVRDD